MFLYFSLTHQLKVIIYHLKLFAFPLYCINQILTFLHCQHQPHNYNLRTYQHQQASSYTHQSRRQLPWRQLYWFPQWRSRTRRPGTRPARTRGCGRWCPWHWRRRGWMRSAAGTCPRRGRTPPACTGDSGITDEMSH